MKKKIHINFSVIFVLFLAFFSNAQASTLYVNSGGSGADVGNCQTAPGCATLTYLDSQMSATGTDVAMIGAGTGLYVENDSSVHAWKINKSGLYSFQASTTVEGNASGTRALYVGAPNVIIEGPVTIDGQTKADTIDTNSGATGFTLRSNAQGRPTILGGTTSLIDIGPSSGNINWTLTNVNFVLNNQRLLRRYINGVTMSGLYVSGSASANIFENISATGTVMNTVTDSNFGTTSSPLSLNAGSVFNVLPSSWTIGTVGHGNNFYLSGTGASLFAANTSGADAGILNVAANSITHTGNFGAPAFSLGFGKWSLTFGGDTDPTHQYVGVLGTTFTQSLVKLSGGQPAPIIRGTTFETMSPLYVDHVAVWNGTTPGFIGAPLITHNIFKTRSSSGHVIIVGSETGSAGDNNYDGAEVSFNQIYGPLYFDKTVAAPTIHGTLLGYLVNGKLHNNYYNGVGLGVGAKADGNMSYTSGGVYDNIGINIGNSSMGAFIAKGIGGLPFLNNVIYSDITMPQPASCFQYEENATGTFSTNGLIKNNICFAQHLTPMVWFAALGDISGFASDHNLYWSENGQVSFRVATSTYDFASWKNLSSSYDPNSPLPADPQWVSASSGCSYNSGPECDFHLTTNSPAVNSGVDVGLSADYAGSILSGIPDIGVYQYLLSAKDILTFILSTPAATGTVDNSAHTITLHVPYGTLLTNLMPILTISGTTVLPASGASQNFVSSVPVNYVVTAENGSSTAYAVSIIVDPMPSVGGGTSVGSAPRVVTVNNLTQGKYSAAFFDDVLHLNYASDTVAVLIGIDPLFTKSSLILATSSLVLNSGTTTNVYIRFCDRHAVCTPTIIVPKSTIPAQKTNFEKNLRFGMRSSDVMRLQKYLNAHGFLVAQNGPGSTGEETDYFGPATLSALRHFQEVVLRDDSRVQVAKGSFGPLTRAYINK